MGFTPKSLQHRDAAGNINGLGMVPLSVLVNPPVSLAAGKVASIKPGFPFIVSKVETYTRTKAGTVTGDVKKSGGNSVLSGGTTFTAATQADMTNSSTRADRIGTASDTIDIYMTTDGTGALVDGRVTVWIRPFPMAGEVA